MKYQIKIVHLNTAHLQFITSPTIGQKYSKRRTAMFNHQTIRYFEILMGINLQIEIEFVGEKNEFAIIKNGNRGILAWVGRSKHKCQGVISLGPLEFETVCSCQEVPWDKVMSHCATMKIEKISILSHSGNSIEKEVIN